MSPVVLLLLYGLLVIVVRIARSFRSGGWEVQIRDDGERVERLWRRTGTRRMWPRSLFGKLRPEQGAIEERRQLLR